VGKDASGPAKSGQPARQLNNKLAAPYHINYCQTERSRQAVRQVKAPEPAVSLGVTPNHPKTQLWAETGQSTKSINCAKPIY
jgi:hypothetical protein